MKHQSDLILDVEETVGDDASEIVDLRWSCIWSIQYSFSGDTPTSSLVVQGSNDKETWSEIESVSITEERSGIKNYADVGYAYGRVFNDYSSGAASLKVWSSKKGA